MFKKCILSIEIYLKGYRIKTSHGIIGSIDLPKWDFGGDKPWTYSIWNKTLNSIREIDEASYPLIVSDLDDATAIEFQLKNKLDLDDWIKKISKY